ncbi:VWA domain-containing protein [Methylovulum psychrotolerans]|uniref:VWA domain-containing protein n=1 Tax=Methylovulum psychrotolerans TaxID=1704499 RepID=UPI0018DF5328|nr:VWA domain-containing protein [Methylovulum psychrotolerans]
MSIIVDTSGSMRDSDKSRYTLQLSQILADLLDTDDSLTVIHLPPGQNDCNDRANPSLAMQFNSAYRSSFQAKLDKALYYSTDNNFAAPVHTAQADLEQHKTKARLLLFVADSGGLGKNCDAKLTQDLQALRNQGVTIAAVNIGGLGAFDANPAFTFTTGARDSNDLVKSVAEVYQKFIGAKHVQTGSTNNAIEFELESQVKNAYLVIVADGRLNALTALDGNPQAGQVDLNYKGGGHAIGLDGLQRDYRIVRMHRPQSGHWRFQVPDLKKTAGWMLLQDSALALRLTSAANAAQDITTPLEAELYDQETGKGVYSPRPPAGFQASVEIEGRTVMLHDDGQDGDRKAGDGVFTASTRFSQVGTQQIRLNLQSSLLDRHSEATVQVEAVDWGLQASVPEHVEVDNPVNLTVKIQPGVSSHSPMPPQAIDVYIDGKAETSLYDDGKNGDTQAGDSLYAGTWTPHTIADYSLDFKAVAGGNALPTKASIKVIGSIRFGLAIPVNFGRRSSNSQVQNHLDLGNDTLVKGEYPLTLSSNYSASGSVVEIDLGQGWVPLDARPQPFVLGSGALHSWPLRLRVGDCPASVTANDHFSIEFSGTDANGQPVRHSVPLRLEIAADWWLHCWWPVLATAVAGLLGAIVIYGFWSPSRFSPKLGVFLSPEEDINEGFFHPIYAQRGTGNGFYRDARVYIRQDFRLSGNAKGELARLRADGKQVFIRPAPGAVVYRQNFDGEWEVMPANETAVNFGVIYKDSLGALFFQLRNG